MQIQELQAELARLQEAESQWKQYQKRSVESLQKELEMHEQEAIRLFKKIQDGAKEEFDWVEHVVVVECVALLYVGDRQWRACRWASMS